ncbi:MAG: heavy metal translocating P-type ATPase [Clostridiaceae bacterium]|nr:heavy metal translocating P-type ATPase [Clostridiaceae bacterium]
MNGEAVVIKEFILTGLDCANCAAKMELGIRSLDGIKDASLNFVTKKLRLEIYGSADQINVIKEASEIIKKIEPDVKPEEITDKKPEEINPEIEDESYAQRLKLARTGIGAALFAAAVLLKLSAGIELAIYLAAYIFVGGEVLVKSIRNISKGQVFDENFLMGIATIGAFAIGEYSEGVAVMLFYQVGEMFQELAVNRSRKSIKALMDIRPDYANLITEGQPVQVPPEEVAVGDHVIVKPGERVPLDGKITEGRSMVDTSALTGESVPREVSAGDEILAGFINNTGVLTVEVSREFGESTVSKILDMVQNASSKKSQTENFITKFARYYTPIVVFSALALALVPPLVLPGEAFSEWIYRALIFLVVSCPCALVISIPLGFFGGIGGASKNGVLIKGSNYLEALNYVDTVVFDKTGTLTKGVFKVTEVRTTEGIKKEEMLKYAAYAESYSGHPIALSILKAYGSEVNSNEVSNYEEIPGHGVRAEAFGRKIAAGNAKMMQQSGLTGESPDTAGTLVHLAIDGVYAGYIVISDEVKEDAEKAVRLLKDSGIRKTVMLTGDIRTVGEKIGAELGIDEVYSELLPDQKVERLEEIKDMKSKGKVAFAGDGINDAPVLARADIGIAMGGLGSDAAIEAADIVIMTDEPSKIVTAIKIAKKTRRIVLQNIVFAMGVKAVVLLLGAAGFATMWEAVFADVGVALIAVLNSMRVLNLKNI